MFGDSLQSYSTVKTWFNEFNCGRRLLKDQVREGRPKTAFMSENIDAVRELIKQNRHVAYREIKAFLVISSTSIHSILHEHLLVKKICFRWLPPNLTISIGVEKQTQMTVVRRNILSTIMLKKVKLSYGNVRFHRATPEICQVRNVCSYPRNSAIIVDVCDTQRGSRYEQVLV